MSKLKDTAICMAIGAAPFAIVGLLANPVGAQTADCPKCDELNGKQGTGGAGFYGWTFTCPPGNSNGVVTVNVTTKGQPGVWTAIFGDDYVEFEGTATLSSSDFPGVPVMRSLTAPDGRVVIPPKFEVFDCDCDDTTSSSTVYGPPATPVIPEPPAAPSVTVPGATATTVGRSTTPPNKPGTLPATGGGVGWYVLLGGAMMAAGYALGKGAQVPKEEEG
jgi:hypothetical protein